MMTETFERALKNTPAFSLYRGFLLFLLYTAVTVFGFPNLVRAQYVPPQFTGPPYQDASDEPNEVCETETPASPPLQCGPILVNYPQSTEPSEYVGYWPTLGGAINGWIAAKAVDSGFVGCTLASHLALAPIGPSLWESTT